MSAVFCPVIRQSRVIASSKRQISSSNNATDKLIFARSAKNGHMTMPAPERSAALVLAVGIGLSGVMRGATTLRFASRDQLAKRREFETLMISTKSDPMI